MHEVFIPFTNVYCDVPLRWQGFSYEGHKGVQLLAVSFGDKGCSGRKIGK